MKESITLLSVLILISIIIFLLALFIFEVVPNFLNHTIFKERYKSKLTQRINDIIKFNNYKIEQYKGIKHDKIQEYEDEVGICTCCNKEFYLKEGVDESLIQECVSSEEEALKWFNVAEEKYRKQDVQKRLSFIEQEIKDIKKIIWREIL